MYLMLIAGWWQMLSLTSVATSMCSILRTTHTSSMTTGSRATTTTIPPSKRSPDSRGSPTGGLRRGWTPAQSISAGARHKLDSGVRGFALGVSCAMTTKLRCMCVSAFIMHVSLC